MIELVRINKQRDCVAVRDNVALAIEYLLGTAVQDTHRLLTNVAAILIEEGLGDPVVLHPYGAGSGPSSPRPLIEFNSVSWYLLELALGVLRDRIWVLTLSGMHGKRTNSCLTPRIVPPSCRSCVRPCWERGCGCERGSMAQLQADGTQQMDVQSRLHELDRLRYRATARNFRLHCSNVCGPERRWTR